MTPDTRQQQLDTMQVALVSGQRLKQDIDMLIRTLEALLVLIRQTPPPASDPRRI